MFSRSPQIESELTLAVRELREELRAMREVLTELAEAAKWQNNNAEDYPVLVHDRSSLWTLADTRLPELIETLTFGPARPLAPIQPGEERSQRDLF